MKLLMTAEEVLEFHEQGLTVREILELYDFVNGRIENEIDQAVYEFMRSKNKIGGDQ